MNPDITSETALSISDVKEELDKIEKRDKELNFRTQKTKDYIEHFFDKESKKLRKKIKDLDIPRLKDKHIIKLVDIKPTTVEELKSVLSGYTLSINKKNAKKIVDVIPEPAN